MHIPGDTATLSSATVYAGILYLICAIVSIGFWVRGALAAGQLSRAAAPLSSQAR